MGKTVRKTLEEVREYFLQQGCELLEEHYENAHAIMNYRCVCGSLSKTNLNRFKSGKRCGCRRQGINQFSKDEIVSEVESLGYKFISVDYLNNRHIVKCICKCGKERACTLQNLRRNLDCVECRNDKERLSYEEVRLFFQEQGCELLEKEYLNARTKMKYRCICGTESEIVLYAFKAGCRCQNCKNRKTSERNKLLVGDKNPRWIKDRDVKRQNDLFCGRCRSMVRMVYKAFGLKKNIRSESIIGYKFSDLRSHLESFSNWDYVKDKVWNIDHVFPLKAFIDYGIKDIRLVNSLDNLQPMLEHDNISKSGKYDSIFFEKWLKLKNVQFKKKGGVV